MKIALSLTMADKIVLIAIAALLVLGVRVVAGFFR
jgi:hypothetical protein